MKTNPQKTVKNSLTLLTALFGCAMTLATIAPVYALSKSDVNQAATIAPTGQKSIIVAQATRSVQGNRKDEVIRKGFMETSFNLDSNGNLNAMTKTWSDMNAKGFTGGVVIVFTDASGGAIWSTEQQTYGVDGKWIGKSSRTETWRAKVPSEIRSQISGYAIYQEHAPRGRTLAWLQSPDGQATIKAVVTIIRNN